MATFTSCGMTDLFDALLSFTATISLDDEFDDEFVVSLDFISDKAFVYVWF